MKRHLIFALLIAAAVLSSAAAQEREKPPAGGPPKPFTVPAKQAWTLKNGLKVTSVQYGSIPKATIRAYVRAGNLNEAATQIWLADLTGELMKEGAGTRTGTQLAEEAARLGGQLTVSVGAEQTQVTLDVLSEFAPDAIALVADVLERPTLPGSEVARLKADQLRRLAVSRSQPQAIANELFAKTLYGDHPFGRPYPTEDMIKGFTIDDAQKFYKANFGAQRTHLFIAGKFDAVAAHKAINAAFEKWERGPEAVTNPPKAVPVPKLVTSDRPNAPQSTLRLGIPVPDPSSPDYVALAVTNSLLGGSFMSRITSNIREQKGYTYSPFSSVPSRYLASYWVENADVTTKVTGEAISEIYKEVAGLRKASPPADELKGITTNMAGTFVLQNSSRAGIISQLNFVDFHGLGDSWLTSYVPKVTATTPADVQRISEKYLDPAKMTLVVVGDLGKIQDQLKLYRAE